MSDEQRGILLVQQEKLTQKIAQMTQSLSAKGSLMTEFGRKLTASPSQVTFSNAPSPLGNYLAEPMHEPSTDWGQMLSSLDLTAIAQAIQDLRSAKTELRQITQQLQASLY